MDGVEAYRRYQAGHMSRQEWSDIMIAEIMPSKKKRNWYPLVWALYAASLALAIAFIAACIISAIADDGHADTTFWAFVVLAPQYCLVAFFNVWRAFRRV